jgi:hypothetical protein
MMPALVVGSTRDARSASVDSCARTAAIVVPSVIRAAAFSVRAVGRSLVSPGIADSGSHTSVTLGKRNRSRMTPTTVDGLPLTRIERPTTDTSPPYRAFHTPALRMTTGGAPGRSSADSKSRPMSGRSRSSWNSGAER